jgi:hypothetical protein
MAPHRTKMASSVAGEQIVLFKIVRIMVLVSPLSRILDDITKCRKINVSYYLYYTTSKCNVNLFCLHHGRQ